MITAFALKNSRTVVYSMVLVVLAGALLMIKQPRLEDPFIVIREALITTKFPGMAPERVERLITRVIEEQARTMSELDDIWSTSKRGESIIHFEIADEVPAAELPATWKKLRNKLHDVVPSLPAGTIGPMVNDEFGDTAVATVALWSDGFSMADMRGGGSQCQRASGHHGWYQEDRSLRCSRREGSISISSMPSWPSSASASEPSLTRLYKIRTLRSRAGGSTSRVRRSLSSRPVTSIRFRRSNPCSFRFRAPSRPSPCRILPPSAAHTWIRRTNPHTTTDTLRSF